MRKESEYIWAPPEALKVVWSLREWQETEYRYPENTRRAVSERVNLLNKIKRERDPNYELG